MATTQRVSPSKLRDIVTRIVGVLFPLTGSRIPDVDDTALRSRLERAVVARDDGLHALRAARPSMHTKRPPSAGIAALRTQLDADDSAMMEVLGVDLKG